MTKIWKSQFKQDSPIQMSNDGRVIGYGPIRVMTIEMFTAEEIALFWDHTRIDENGEHDLWRGKVDKTGIPHYRYTDGPYKTRAAARQIAWIFHHGISARGKWIGLSCGLKLCLLKEHMFDTNSVQDLRDAIDGAMMAIDGEDDLEWFRKMVEAKAKTDPG